MGSSCRKKAIGWLLFSVPAEWSGPLEQPAKRSVTRSSPLKNEGLEEETLVTSSNPFSQVLW